MLSGRSDSMVEDEEEEIVAIAKCKAINSSYINLKRQNILMTFGKR